MPQESKPMKAIFDTLAITEKCNLVKVKDFIASHSLTNSLRGHSKRRSTIPSQVATEDMKEKVTQKGGSRDQDYRNTEPYKLQGSHLQLPPGCVFSATVVIYCL